ncbi:hypothetical protein GCM10007881_64760 [Mesorhizobium huakuii]|nr:hypothetical protein GCM10007881_64760 [Mesorhizobium huakuii]
MRYELGAALLAAAPPIPAAILKQQDPILLADLRTEAGEHLAQIVGPVERQYGDRKPDWTRRPCLFRASNPEAKA